MYQAATLKDQIIDWTIIALGTLVIGGCAGVAGMKFLTYVLNDHDA